MHEVSEHNNKDMSNNTNKNNSSNTNTNPHQHANIRSRRGSSTCRQWGATRPPLPAASPLSALGGRFMAAASPLLDAAVQLEVGAREQCECDPCCSDGEEFDEACSHGTHCAACQVWQTAALAGEVVAFRAADVFKGAADSHNLITGRRRIA